MFKMIHCTYNKIDQDRFSVFMPHGMNQYTFVQFLNPVKISVYNQTMYANSNSCILFSPNIPFQYESINQLELHTSFFYFLADEQFMNQFHIPCNQVLSITPEQVVGNHILMLFSYVVEQSHLQSIEEQATTELLFAFISKMLYRTKDTPAHEETDMLNHVRLTVFSNVATDWNAKTMAQLTNLSVPQFYKQYKKIFHITPMEDLNQYRIESAKRLINSGYSISNVSAMIGMNSTQYFTDFFKKRVGCTPTEYRKRLAQQENK